MWGYQAESGHRTGTDLTGFKVEASDGSIGKVDKYIGDAGCHEQVGGSYGDHRA